MNVVKMDKGFQEILIFIQSVFKIKINLFKLENKNSCSSQNLTPSVQIMNIKKCTKIN